VRVGISNFRNMVCLFDCLQYYLLVADDGLPKRKFVLYFCFVAIFCTFCGPFYYLTRRLIFRLYICITITVVCLSCPVLSVGGGVAQR